MPGYAAAYITLAVELIQILSRIEAFYLDHCRGGPPWPPLFANHAGVATEGHPYNDVVVDRPK